MGYFQHCYALSHALQAYGFHCEETSFFPSEARCRTLMVMILVRLVH